MKQAILIPSKFVNLYPIFKKKPFKLLDIGAGNHSASLTKYHFPTCEYHGVDLDKSYNNNEEDFSVMTAFYELNLTKLNFDIIPNNYFDCIMMAHIIEHLENGDKVIEMLIPKLKQGGYIYIEFPGEKSLKLPSVKDTLNFYDDITHVRMYSSDEISSLLRSYNFSILKAGTRRLWAHIFAMPFKMVYQFLTKGYVQGSTYWDITGFAEFVFAKRNA